MKVGFLDIILFIAIFQLLGFSIFLFTKKPHKISNTILGLFLFAEFLGIFSGLTFSQFQFFIQYAPHLFLIGLPFCLVWGPLFYLYVRSIENPAFKIKTVYILHFIPFTVECIILSTSFYFLDSLTKGELIRNVPAWLYYNFKIVNVFIMIQILIYNIISLYILYQYRRRLKENYSSISKLNYSWLSIVIVGYTLAHFFSMYVSILNFSYHGADYLTRTLLLATFLLFFNIIFFKGWRQPEIFSEMVENVKYKSSRLTKEEADNWISKINNIICEKKPYMNPGISINQLAEEIDIQPRVLSQIINEYFNQNFYDYINGLRIEESKRLLLDSSNRMNVLEILYEVGFNSKPSFNTAFKKVTGLTPTQFKKVNK